MGHNGHGINLYGVVMILMGNLHAGGQSSLGHLSLVHRDFSISVAIVSLKCIFFIFWLAVNLPHTYIKRRLSGLLHEFALLPATSGR